LDRLPPHGRDQEQLFYLELLRVGKGAGGKPTAEDETEDAIHDHNDIRYAVTAVAAHEVGSKGWFDAVARANEANSDHMGEEEREALTDFRCHAALHVRHDLAVAFFAFEAVHVLGVEAVDKDPEE